MVRQAQTYFAAAVSAAVINAAAVAAFVLITILSGVNGVPLSGLLSAATSGPTISSAPATTAAGSPQPDALTGLDRHSRALVVTGDPAAGPRSASPASAGSLTGAAADPSGPGHAAVPEPSGTSTAGGGAGPGLGSPAGGPSAPGGPSGPIGVPTQPGPQQPLGPGPGPNLGPAVKTVQQVGIQASSVDNAVSNIGNTASNVDQTASNLSSAATNTVQQTVGAAPNPTGANSTRGDAHPLKGLGLG
jgi:hypothetical protein